MSGLDLGTGFQSVADRLPGERAERIDRSRRIMSFGVKFLDEALGGVFPNDLIIIGAASGEGKTALCTTIAHHNVKLGKRIHYFALEAEEREIERRMKYREISDMIYRSEECRYLRPRLNYIDWYAGKLDGVLGPEIEGAVDKMVASKFSTMWTYYKRGVFGADELNRLLLAIQDETDAAIIDHLHYVDTDDAESENRGVKRIVMRVRDASLMLGKAMFLVAHLRKKDRKGAALVPDLDDFHGTSETPKVATKAIMIARARNQQSSEPHLWPTYIYAPKCRMDGGRTQYCALVNFNARTQSYDETYVLGRLSFGLDEFEALSNSETPTWAASAVR